MNKADALDLLAWARRFLQYESDEVTLSKRTLANLLALAERAPLRGGANVKSGREQIHNIVVWHKLRSEYRKRRDRGETEAKAAESIREEFTPRYLSVLRPFDKPLSRQTLIDRLTRRHPRRR